MITILNQQQIEHKIRRIAYQIYEVTLNETEFVLAGIDGNGYVFAQKLYEQLQQISSQKITLCKVFVNKKNVLDTVTTSVAETNYQNKVVVLVDDVLNSGATLIYGIKHFLNVPLKDFKTAVLVDRNHKKFPVKADFKGISLSTSLKEHIEVNFETEASAILI